MEVTQRSKIWLVKSHEPLPFNQEGDRMFRMGIFYTLLERIDQYDITWWSSSFSHYRKKQVCINSYNTSEFAKVQIINSPGYSKNKSIKRFIDHTIIGLKFFVKGLKAPKPNLILCAFPIFSTALATILLSKLRGIPYIIDYRDKWPEVYWENHLKGAKKRLVKIIVYPLEFLRNQILQNSWKISTISSEFLNITSAITGERVQDRAISFSYIKNEKKEKDLTVNPTLKDFIELNKSKKIVCFIGTIGYLGDVETIYKSATILRESKDFCFIFCGTGDMLNHWSYKYQEENILNTGFVGNDELAYVLRNSSIGVLPYLDNETWNSTIPNKLVEYLSEGLFLLCSSGPTSLMAQIITNNKIGKLYKVFDEVDLVNKLKSIKAEDLVLKNERKKIYEENFGIVKLQEELKSLLQ